MTVISSKAVRIIQRPMSASLAAECASATLGACEYHRPNIARTQRCGATVIVDRRRPWNWLEWRPARNSGASNRSSPDDRPCPVQPPILPRHTSPLLSFAPARSGRAMHGTEINRMPEGRMIHLLGRAGGRARRLRASQWKERETVKRDKLDTAGFDMRRQCRH